MAQYEHQVRASITSIVIGCAGVTASTGRAPSAQSRAAESMGQCRHGVMFLRKWR